MRALVERKPEARLPEYCQDWERETAVMVSPQTMSRMLLKVGLRRKKTIGAMERDEAARQDWRECAETMPARRIVILDETSTHLDMTSRYAREPRGQCA